MSIPTPSRAPLGFGRGRKPSRLTAREWRTVVVMLYKPWRAPIAFQAMSARLSGEPSRIGAPARIRSENLRVLSAAPLPYWATGAKMVRAIRFEPILARPSTSCLLPIGLRAPGASRGIPTHTGPGLKRPLAVGLCSRRPFRCCSGFSGLRGRRLSWWSNGCVNWQPAEESNPDRELQRLPSCR